MKIGIIGSGNMGSAIGKLWAKAGHHILFSHSRSEQKLQSLAAAIGSNAQTGTPTDAAHFGEVILLAVPPAALDIALQASEAMAGKVLISCVSPFRPDFEGNAVDLRRTIKLSTSMAEEIARRVPAAKVVEAFNLTFARILEMPSRSFGSLQASLPYCGDDDVAKAIAVRLIEDCGFEAVDAGALRNARSLEPMATIWVQLAGVTGFFPEVAFKVLRS